MEFLGAGARGAGGCVAGRQLCVLAAVAAGASSWPDLDPVGRRVLCRTCSAWRAGGDQFGESAS